MKAARYDDALIVLAHWRDFVKCGLTPTWPWLMRSRPVRRRVKNFFFRPTAGKKRNGTPLRAIIPIAYVTNVTGMKHRRPPILRMSCSPCIVNNGACAEEKERFEKAVREQVQDACSNTAHTQGDHHQTEL